MHASISAAEMQACNFLYDPEQPVCWHHRVTLASVDGKCMRWQLPCSSFTTANCKYIRRRYRRKACAALMLPGKVWHSKISKVQLGLSSRLASSDRKIVTKLTNVLLSRMRLPLCHVTGTHRHTVQFAIYSEAQLQGSACEQELRERPECAQCTVCVATMTSHTVCMVQQLC